MKDIPSVQDIERLDEGNTIDWIMYLQNEDGKGDVLNVEAWLTLSITTASFTMKKRTQIEIKYSQNCSITTGLKSLIVCGSSRKIYFLWKSTKNF